jgi:signal transduction histidine kinase
MLENLINDLLDLAKLENNTFSLTKEYFNLMDTIYQAFKIS